MTNSPSRIKPLARVCARSRATCIALLMLTIGIAPLSARPKPRSTRTVRPVVKRTLHSRYGVPTFADSAKDDIATYDDPVVRKAAIEGLGSYNGSVVAIEPSTGRILSVVNQKLAFS